MSKIVDRLVHAVASLKKQSPAVGAAVQGLTTEVGTLETQMQQMLAQNPANRMDLQKAASTLQGVKTQLEALVAALQSASSAAAASSVPPPAPASGGVS